MFYTIKLCKGKAAYETVPKKDLDLDLFTAESKLKELGYITLQQTPIILVMKKNYNVHIYPRGKLVIDDCSKEEADKTAKQIYSKLGVLNE